MTLTFYCQLSQTVKFRTGTGGIVKSKESNPSPPREGHVTFSSARAQSEAQFGDRLLAANCQWAHCATIIMRVFKLRPVHGHTHVCKCVCVTVPSPRCKQRKPFRALPASHFPSFAPLVVGFLCLLVLLFYDGRFAVKQALSRSLTLSSSLATTAESTLPSFSLPSTQPFAIARGKLTIIARRLCLICFQGLLFFATTWKLITIVHKAIFPCSNVANTAHISIISFSKV